MTWALLAVVLLLVFNALTMPAFFRITVHDGHLFGSLIDVLNRAAPVMLVSLGMTLVIATGGVDLSVGAVMAIAGATAAVLIEKGTQSLPVLLAAGFGTAFLGGLLNGGLVAGLRIQPIVATLILMVAGRGVAQLITDGQIPSFKHPSFEFIGSGFLFGLPFTLTLVVAAAALIYLLARKTAFGLFLESIGGNEKAAGLAGVNVAAAKLGVYIASALCAGLAGLVATADIGVADASNIGLYIELDAILAVVIGGTILTGGRFTIIGSLAGALLMQLLTTTILSRGIHLKYTLVVKAVVVIVVCLLQSEQFRALLRWRRRAA